MKGMLFIVSLMLAVVVAGCDGGYESQTSSDEASMEAHGGALMASGSGNAEGHNNEGVEHYGKGHWDIAKDHFQQAVAADANLAEAHYNLALTLDKMGDHGEATRHFQMALDHGAGNPAIKDSGILKAHLGM